MLFLPAYLDASFCLVLFLLFIIAYNYDRYSLYTKTFYDKIVKKIIINYEFGRDSMKRKIFKIRFVFLIPVLCYEKTIKYQKVYRKYIENVHKICYNIIRLLRSRFR